MKLECRVEFEGEVSEGSHAVLRISDPSRIAHSGPTQDYCWEWRK